MACYHDNNRKGDNLSGVDPETGEPTFLFHPRKDNWTDHFSWNGALLAGRTPKGRTTIEVLEINDSERVLARELLIAMGHMVCG